MYHLFAVISLLPALLFGQVPEFMQQYRQRLGGATDEMTSVVRHFDEDSRRSGYERNAALELMARNSESLIRDQALRMKENIQRLNRLNSQQAAFANGVSLESVAAFAINYDKPLFDKTLESYVLAIPLTIAGFTFSIVGWVLSYLGLMGLASAFRSRSRPEA
jgi:hypothetical protein